MKIPRDNPEIAVIIPCYNESHHITRVVASIPEYIHTVIIVDDCSTDNTLDVLRNIHDPRVTVLKHTINQGVGAAMVTGYQEALTRNVSICVKMDGDGQMVADYLPELLQPLLRREADYSKGNRFLNVQALKAMPMIRLIGNGVLSFLTKLVSGYWSIFDPTNGYTAIFSDTLRQMNFSSLQKRYFFETSMLVELNIINAVVEDVYMPAQYGDEESSLRIGSTILKFPTLLMKSLMRRFFWRYLIRDFNALTICVLAGLPSVTFGIIFGGYHWYRSVIDNIPATAGTTVLAFLPIILGFQLILVALVLDILYQPTKFRDAKSAKNQKYNLYSLADKDLSAAG
jgi:dolichol-phosphate mannosyltransferase